MSNTMSRYLELAKRKGFLILSLQATSGHQKVEVRGPSGVVFQSTLASSPSENRSGPHNWVRDLKRAEQTAIARGATPMPVELHPSHRMSPADIEEGKALLLRLTEDPDELLMRYDVQNQTRWHVNRDRTTSKGKIAPKIALWLQREGFVQEADSISDMKTVYTVTKSGLATAQKIKLNLPVKHEEPTSPVSGALTLTPPPEPSSSALSARQKLILEETDALSDEDLRLLFFYGIGMLKDDIKARAQIAKQEIDKRTEADIARLSKMEETLTCQ